MINNATGVSPKALLNYDTFDANKKLFVDEKMQDYDNRKEFYIKKNH